MNILKTNRIKSAGNDIPESVLCCELSLLNGSPAFIETDDTDLIEFFEGLDAVCESNFNGSEYKSIKAMQNHYMNWFLKINSQLTSAFREVNFPLLLQWSIFNNQITLHAFADFTGGDNVYKVFTSVKKTLESFPSKSIKIQSQPSNLHKFGKNITMSHWRFLIDGQVTERAIQG